MNPTNTSGGGLNVTQLTSFASTITGFINNVLVPLLIAVAFIVFLWGVFNYFIFGATDPKKLATGQQFILWSVVGFVIIFSLWGLVGIGMQLFNFSGNEVHAPYPLL